MNLSNNDDNEHDHDDDDDDDDTVEPLHNGHLGDRGKWPLSKRWSSWGGRGIIKHRAVFLGYSIFIFKKY